ncbi:hypothetical protein [Streptomyces sp. UNOC14_S4]|uniref:hypothetical protein n=1 Tax=Streptomyces sp. UNOC14_S4 TaxID=2872340 RepID=UPI001E530314|nr:hypothetical protein [Streptomyces sp. UNOC14_S4]MCC3771622.1 hypothetical protein [Streptomyces sp. UNOC14_S4]
MPEPPGRPVGIQGIEDLFQECRTRVQDGRTATATATTAARDRHGLPVITLVGTRGSGKSTALNWLGYLGSHRPHALYDFGSAARRRPHEVAGRLAYGLSHRFPRQPALRFPRLTLGLLVVDPGLSLDPNDARRAGAQLRRALQEVREHTVAAERAADVADLLQDLSLVQIPGAGLLAGLIRRPPNIPLGIARRTGLSWYAGPHTPLDELVALNRLSKSEADADRAAVDRRLCEAFLADLRGEYARRKRDRNCVVLLDNIDTEGGREFLDLLLRLRDAATAPDPLLVVATASDTARVPGPFARGPAGVRVHPPERSSYEDWERAVPEPPPDSSWRWYCVRLRDLTQGEVAQLGSEVAARLPEAPPLVHRLTGGHPWSVSRLLDAAALLAGRDDHETALRGILSLPVRPSDGTPSGPPLGRAVLHDLLQDLTEDQRAALVVCAAARTFDSACDAGLLDSFSIHTRNTLAGLAGTRLWLVDPEPQDAGARGGRGSGYLEHAHPHPLPGTPELHPWLRLLLLQKLARRRGVWDDTHAHLQNWHRLHGHPLDVTYHALARGRLDDAVEHLALGLTELPDTDAWLYELYAVTAAPLREPVVPQWTAAVRVDGLAADLAPGSFTTRRALTVLVTALWLAADPRNRLPSGSPELNLTIGSMFQDLALHSDPRRVGLRHEAAKYH